MKQEIRILMLEDMVSDAELVAYELRKGGLSFVYKRVDTREDFLAALDNSPPDIVLADYHLPQFDGMEAFRLKVERKCDASFIIVSGALSEEVAVQCMKEGVDDYILKSNLKRLCSAVTSALEKRDLRISEAKALASLKDSESRYKRIAEAITDYVYTVYVENGVPVRTLHRPGSESVTGYAPEEFDRDPYLWLSIVLDEDRKSVEEYAAQVLLGQAMDPIEHRIRKKDGEIRWVRNTSVLNMNAEKGVISYDGLIQDITERKKTELKLSKEREILSHLLMISEATASITNVDKLLYEVAKRTTKVKGCDYCLIYLWDKASQRLQPAQAFGLSHSSTPLFRTKNMSMDQEFIKKSFSEKQAIYLDLTNHENKMSIDALACISDAVCCIVAPLLSRGYPLGVMVNACKTACSFTEWDKTLMQGISHQLSVALEQARLYTDSIGKTMELSNKVLTIEVMHEIGRSILSTLEPQEILETVVGMTSRVIPCDGTAVLLVDKENGGFVYKFGDGLPFVFEDVFIPFSNTLASEILETGMPQYIASLSEIKPLPPLEEGLLKEGYKSHIRVPIIVKNEIIGILMVDSVNHVFIHGDLEILEKLAYQIGIALQNAKQVSDLEELFLGTVKSLSSAIDAKSRWTSGHSMKVADLAVTIGTEMGLGHDELKRLELGSLLHDIGKIGTYETILDKPGDLTDEEKEMINLHPEKGAEILGPIKQLRDIIPAIRCHQEHYDGSGYPNGLRGDEIPLDARIIAVADTTEAMTSDRPYRKGRSLDEVKMELKRCTGTHFDPEVVKVALKVL